MAAGVVVVVQKVGRKLRRAAESRAGRVWGRRKVLSEGLPPYLM